MALFFCSREVIERKPEEFKIACMRDVQKLFPDKENPFYAGFGNKINVSNCTHFRFFRELIFMMLKTYLSSYRAGYRDRKVEKLAKIILQISF